ncbi:helix-turn-helix transcriptional regulator [Streptomyces sp. NPDC059928]|uniref:helix-turn-helix transcriptional regulator n=1 Tax=unclassified Streptomyces TaxID=2593676 RepID=UPI0036648E0E
MREVREGGPAVVVTPGRWGFLSSHARVLLTIVQNPDVRLRDIAAACQITERTVLSVIADLERAGCLRRERTGRRSPYILEDADRLLWHPDERHLPVPAVLALLGRRGGDHPVHIPDPPGAVATDSTARIDTEQGPPSLLFLFLCDARVKGWV